MNERKEDEITNDLNGKKRCRLKQEKECIVAKRAKMNIEEEVRVQNEKDKERIKMLEVDDCNRNEQEKASIGMKIASLTKKEVFRNRNEQEKHRIAMKRATLTKQEVLDQNDKDKHRIAMKRATLTKDEVRNRNEQEKHRIATKRATLTKEEVPFCKAHIYDEIRQLHTVWILDRNKNKKGKNVGHVFPVAKLIFNEIVDNVNSKFVIDQNKPDQNDKQFIEEQIRRGFIFKLNSKECDMNNSYYRFGPWTRTPFLDSIRKNDFGISNDVHFQMILPTCFSLGLMNYTCKFCGAKGFKDEIQNKYDDDEIDFGSLCCKGGKVKGGIKDYNLPDDLKKLYIDNEDPVAIRFRAKSSIFGNGMAMSSVTASWRKYSHKIDSMLTASGQLLRRIGPLRNKYGQKPKCVQCLFFGPEEAATYRTKNAFKDQKSSKEENDLDKTIFMKLHQILIDAKNKYVETFLSVKEYVKKNCKGTVANVILALHPNESTEYLIHKSRLNVPQVKEVAVFMPNDIGQNDERMLMFNYMTPEDKVGLEFIPDYHRSYDPLQYPLIFPDGHDGWHPTCGRTLFEHINFMIMDREEIINPILCGRSIGQQFILDQYCKLELQRLRWVELNQKTIRAELYSGFADSVKKSENLQKRGKKVILPSTFIGGDRYMHQQYLDSMTVFQRFGRPHLFITMTANPQWKEIQDILKSDQTVFDRPDLVARVFKLKKQQFVKELYSESICGKCVARTHSIEFQKRGLPHIHILIWLNWKNVDPVMIDKIICAEIPKENLEVPDENNVGKTKLVTNPLFTKVTGSKTTSSMLHGPCGEHNPRRACMCEGFCKYNYPKNYVSRTEMNEDGYPKYRRLSPKEGGNSYETYRNNKKYIFTNGDVVPYNKYLIARFDCHINIEYCNSLSAIKYLFGYINKGCDQATVEVKVSMDNDLTEKLDDENHNEVLEYKTQRYISTAESCWRLRRNEVAERKPAVFRLNVHLPEQQIVYYNPNDYDIEHFKRQLETSKKTPLTAYFDLNKRLCEKKEHETKNDSKQRENERNFVSKLLYRQIPEYYTWNNKDKKWMIRIKKNNNDMPPREIARVYSVHPTEIERYSLRLLLNHIPGVKSFLDLKTVDNEVMSSFHDAAVKLNLVRNDYIWIECMKEANDTQTNISHLRKLFVTILLYCEVGNPIDFYNSCKSFLSSDYEHMYKQEFIKFPQLKHLTDGNDPMERIEKNDPMWTVEQYAQNSTMIYLQQLLSKENRSMESFGLPKPNLINEQFIQNIFGDGLNSMKSNVELTKEKATKYFNQNFGRLNKEQLIVFNRLKDLLNNYINCAKKGKIPREKEGSLVFLDAPGGTGKTFILNVLINWVIMKEQLVVATAASGIAATMLHNGRTVHNQFKVPINITTESMCNISKQSKMASFLRDVLLIIIDEASMLDKLCYETLDRTLKDLTDFPDTKFGGKIVLLSGDFRQLLEVIPRANRAKIVLRCLKGSELLWDENVIHLKLNDNMRIKNALVKRPNDEGFKAKLIWYEQWLLQLGEGKLEEYYDNIIEIPNQMCKETKDDVIDAVFDDFENNVGVPEYYQSRAIVAATNEIVNEINSELLERLPAIAVTKYSIDTVGDDDNPTAFPSEFLNAFNLSGMADHELCLKENTVVILMRNMDIDAGHCNGTRYFVKRIGDYRLVLEKLYSKGNKNNILVLPRIPMTSSPGTKLPFVLKRLQFPIKVAFALTINRSQSQTFSGKLGILLPRSIWTHGQIYVTFSRCGDPNNVFVWANQDEFKELIDSGKLPSGKIYTKNVVYKEVI